MKHTKLFIQRQNQDNYVFRNMPCRLFSLENIPFEEKTISTKEAVGDFLMAGPWQG